MWSGYAMRLSRGGQCTGSLTRLANAVGSNRLASILKRVGSGTLNSFALDEVKAALKHIRMAFSWLRHRLEVELSSENPLRTARTQRSASTSGSVGTMVNWNIP